VYLFRRELAVPKSIQTPQNARSRRTCEALLAATRALVTEQGFEPLTMAAVADRAGVSRRAVYLHFTSRAELVGSLLQYVGEVEDLGGSLQKVWQAPDSLAAVDEWARHLARAHPKILDVARAADRVHRSDPDAALVWEESMRRWQLGSRRLVTWLHDEGNLAAPWTVDTAADMMWALMSLDTLERLTVDCRWSNKRYADRMALLFRSTFVRPVDTSPGRRTPDHRIGSTN
jgi:AcrR family transcriptional regulator